MHFHDDYETLTTEDSQSIIQIWIS